jgi:hypothetical protein
VPFQLITVTHEVREFEKIYNVAHATLFELLLRSNLSVLNLGRFWGSQKPVGAFPEFELWLSLVGQETFVLESSVRLLATILHLSQWLAGDNKNL